MPEAFKIREKLIRILTTEYPIRRVRLLRRFTARDRKQADYHIGQLLSDGFLISTGRARRGSPEILQPSATWEFKQQCPLCMQHIPIVIYPQERGYPDETVKST